MKPKAVLNFIVERPGTIDFKGSMPSIQPSATDPPSATSRLQSTIREYLPANESPPNALIIQS
jgi:hypothetical protein